MGRAGRVSPRSVLLRLAGPAETPQLSLVGGLAVAEALAASTGVRARIRWPNDLLVDGRKVCGILAEAASGADARAHHVILGIGINLRQSAFPESLAERATSLRLVTGRDHDAAALLAAVLGRLEARYADGGAEVPLRCGRRGSPTRRCRGSRCACPTARWAGPRTWGGRGPAGPRGRRTDGARRLGCRGRGGDGPCCSSSTSATPTPSSASTRRARLRASWRLTTRREQTADEWGVFIQTLLATRGIEQQHITGVAISNVVPPVQQALEWMCGPVLRSESSHGGARTSPPIFPSMSTCRVRSGRTGW